MPITDVIAEETKETPSVTNEEFYSSVICVTDRKQVQGVFLEQIEKIAGLGIKTIILREKDLSEEEFYELAKDVNTICQKHGTRLIINTFYKVAIKLGINAVHLPLPILEELSFSDRSQFTEIGTSVHSISDMSFARQLGATYVIAGHIYPTACKQGLPGKGLDFLSSVVLTSGRLPVYAIGGITENNIEKVIKAGAAGGCVMSALMKI